MSSRKTWSDNEIYILKQYYENTVIDEILLMLPNRNRKTIINKAMELGLKNITYKNLCFSSEDVEFIKNNYQSMTDREIGLVLHREPHAIQDKRSQWGLKKEYEKSSYNDLSEFIRRNNLDWKKESMKNCNYKCIITGNRFDDIHHIHGLNLILNETINDLNILIKETMDEYSDEELKSILTLFRLKQNKYPLGICLAKNVHSLFHNTYGYGNNTESQWVEFVKDYKNKKFKQCG